MTSLWGFCLFLLDFCGFPFKLEGMSAQIFKDHFSKQASDYAKYRPVYPEALFKYLASLCTAHDLVWDCATGNGQAALSLADYFENVTASDASEKQIQAATLHPKIEYQIAPAENIPFADASVDLITVAQAIHWFEREKFYAEARRVLKPEGVLAVWVYGLHHITPEVDKVVRKYYDDVVGPFWPPERRLVEEKLTTIAFPFQKITPPHFFMSASWDAEAALNYFRTWSATQKYRDANGKDPIAQIETAFRLAWGHPQKKREVKWPLYFCVGKKGLS